MSVQLNAADKKVVQKCRDDELAHVGDVINRALLRLNIEDKYKSIQQVTSQLCLNQLAPPNKQRKLTFSVSSQYIVFYIFRGGGRCRFCTEDNWDYRKLADSVWIGNDAGNNTIHMAHNDHRSMTVSSNLRGNAESMSQELEDSDGDMDIGMYAQMSEYNVDEYDDDEDEEEEEEQTDPVKEFTNQDFSDDPGNHLQDDFDPELDAIPHAARNLTATGSLCGCHSVGFNTDGKGRQIHGTPYVLPEEWENRFGFTVEVTKAKGDAYAPAGRIRVFDSNHHSKGGFTTEYTDLLSPNMACGGAGEGRGGAPKRQNGNDNPGANCKPQGKVLIVQDGKKDEAGASDEGGEISFKFNRQTVELKHIGLMDIVSSDDKAIKIYGADKSGKKKHWYARSRGYGKNSVQTLKFKRRINVREVEVRMTETSAITEIGFCYKPCPKLAPQSTAKASSTKGDALDIFNQEVKPVIEAEAIYEITEEIRKEAHRNEDFCLTKTEVSVDVDMTAAKRAQEICR